MPGLRPLTFSGRDPARAVTFPNNVLLAPMEGITDRCYRDLVLDLGDVGGACSEFVRLSVSPIGPKTLARELGPPHPTAPVGLQIMSPSPNHVAETVVHAEAVGAPWIDLNFGCPVKRVFNKCAGSALLDFPDRVGAIVAAAADATDLPVTAKIRAGVSDDSRLDDVLDACADAGAAAVILHARLRTDSYSVPARWSWIARATDRLSSHPRPLPLIGNGGVAVADDVHRMLAETGCDGVMVARAAFANPWIFREVHGGPPPTRAEALALSNRYLDLLCPVGGSAHPLPRFKQFIRHVQAGDVFDDAARKTLLRARDPQDVRDYLASRRDAAA